MRNNHADSQFCHGWRATRVVKQRGKVSAGSRGLTGGRDRSSNLEGVILRLHLEETRRQKNAASLEACQRGGRSAEQAQWRIRSRDETQICQGHRQRGTATRAHRHEHWKGEEREKMRMKAGLRLKGEQLRCAGDGAGLPAHWEEKKGKVLLSGRA